MRASRFTTINRAIAVTALAGVAAFMSYSDTLMEAAGRSAGGAEVEAAAHMKVKEQHFARVKSDGTLVSGTALSSQRFGQRELHG